MKRFLTAVLILSFIITNLLTLGLFTVSAVIETPILTAQGTGGLRFEKKSATGYLNVENDMLTIAGKKKEPAEGDDYIVTEGITGQSLTNFTMKFVYKTKFNEWNLDSVLLRSPDTAADTENSYRVSIKGNKHTDVFEGNGPLLVISKNGTDMEAKKLTSLTTTGEYNVEIKMAGNKIEVRFYSVTASRPSSPTLSYTDSAAAGQRNDAGDIRFTSWGGHFTVGNLTVTDDTTGTDIFTNYKPPFSAYVSGTDMRNGFVNYTEEGVRISSQSMLYSTHAATITQGLLSKTGKSIDGFKMDYLYTPANVTDNIDRLLFCSPGSESGAYVLSLSVGQTALTKNGTTLQQKAFAFTAGISYRIEIEKSYEQTDIHIYENGQSKPGTPTLSYTDATPLPGGDIFFATVKGDYTVSDVNLTEVDDESGRVHPLYSMNFEDGMGDTNIVLGNTTASGLVTEEQNTFLRMIRDDAAGGGNTVLSLCPRTLSDFTFNAMIRMREYENPDWSWINLLFHSPNPGAASTGNNAMMFQNGSCFSILSPANGWTGDYIIGKTGPNTGGGSPFPNHDNKKGMPADGDWHKMSIVAEGADYFIYVDGILILQATDTDRLYTQGYFLLAGWGTSYDVDDIKIYAQPHTDIAYTPPAQPEGLIYDNNFQTGALGDVNITGGTLAECGVLREGDNQFLRMVHDNAAGGGNTYFTFGPKGVTTFTMNMMVRMTSLLNPDWSWMSVFYRSQGQEYTNVAQIFQNGSSFAVIDRSKGWDSSHQIAMTGPAGSSPFPNHDNRKGLPVDGMWHKVSVVADGFTYSLYYNGVLILQTTDSTELFAKGGFACGGWGVSYDVDDIKIYTTPNTDLEYTDPNVLEGQVYTNTFEDKTLGDVQITYGDPKKTGLVTEDGNSFLRMTREDNPTGGMSEFLFGPKNAVNFTCSMDVRMMEYTNPDWSSLSVKFRSQNSPEYTNDAQIFRNGSAFAVIDASKKWDTQHRIAATGPATDRSPNPNHDPNMGLPVDGEWHKVSIVADGFKYSLYFDGVLILQTTDKTELFEKGGFRGSGWGVSYDVDNISVNTAVYYDLTPSGNNKELPIGLVFYKDFEDKDLDGMTIRLADKEKTKIQEENGNKYLRLMKDSFGDGNLGVDFGPKGVADFTFKMKVRVKSMPNPDWSWFNVSFHGDPASIGEDNISAMIFGKGSAISLKSSIHGWNNDNMIAKTGVNQNNASPFPTDDVTKGICPDGAWHDLEVVSKKNTYTIKVDGKTVLTATDPQNLRPKGSFLLGGWGTSIDVDNMSIYNEGGAPVASGQNSSTGDNSNALVHMTFAMVILSAATIVTEGYRKRKTR